MLKTIISIITAVIMTITPITSIGKADKPTMEQMEKRLTMYHELAQEASVVELHHSEDLTAEELENRNGKIIIEEVIGECLNAEGDGRVIGTDNYYINYSNVEGVQAGDIIVTYLVYNDANNYIDDIVIRTDRILFTASENANLYK